MAQQHLLLNGIKVKDLSDDGYTMNFSTTHTEDSGRNQYLSATVTPIGTIGSYSLKWKNLTGDEMAQILQQVLNKPRFLVNYYNGYSGKWEEAYFYASEYNAPARCLKEGEELWDELSFNIIGVEPI